jgi:hypothetical protein
MVRRTTLVLGAVGLLVVGLALRRVTGGGVERPDYDRVATYGDVELRRYPGTVLVETVAPSEGVAFRRLFRYISGANRSATEVAMTAPVETGGDAPGRETAAPAAAGESVAMTAPVESDRTDEGVRMAFYLPSEYDYDSAPRPTDDSVRLVEQPARTLAVLPFSWWTTDGRVARKTRDLLATLDDAGDELARVGEPFLMRYDGPGTPPFLRTNEVAVEVRRSTGG